MARHILSFYEVEHDEDLDPILNDLEKSGAKILDTRINEDGETAEVTVEVEDTKAFRLAFFATGSADWLN